MRSRSSETARREISPRARRSSPLTRICRANATIIAPMAISDRPFAPYDELLSPASLRATARLTPVATMTTRAARGCRRMPMAAAKNT